MRGTLPESTSMDPLYFSQPMMAAFSDEVQKIAVDPGTKALLGAGALGGIASYIVGKQAFQDWKNGRLIRKQNASYGTGGY